MNIFSHIYSTPRLLALISADARLDKHLQRIERDGGTDARETFISGIERYQAARRNKRKSITENAITICFY